MFCAIYKSKIKTSAYLYIKTKDNFDTLPSELLKQFGTPIFVMMLDLSKREKLALANIEKVRESLQSDGFYLQLPPRYETISSVGNHNKKLL